MFYSLFSWWYGGGWMLQIDAVKERLSRVNDRYSMTLLLSTLFSPFRQISAGSVRGPLGVQLRAWMDRLISRFIGALVRTGLLLFGLVAIVMEIIVGLLRVALWPFVPALPILGLVLTLSGVSLWSN